jgi:hypothetical protein
MLRPLYNQPAPVGFFALASLPYQKLYELLLVFGKCGSKLFGGSFRRRFHSQQIPVYFEAHVSPAQLL